MLNPMVLTLTDKTKYSLRYIDGQAKVTFHGLSNHSVLFPKNTAPTMLLVEALYASLKAKQKARKLEIAEYAKEIVEGKENIQ